MYWSKLLILTPICLFRWFLPKLCCLSILSQREKMQALKGIRKAIRCCHGKYCRSLKANNSKNAATNNFCPLKQTSLKIAWAIPLGSSLEILLLQKKERVLFTRLLPLG